MRFNVSQALDHTFADNESEDTQQHSDTAERVSEEEHVEDQPEHTDTSDRSDEEVTGAEADPASAETSVGAQYLLTHMARQLLPMSSKMTPGITRFAVTRGGTRTKNQRRMFLEELGSSLPKAHTEQRERVSPKTQTAAELTKHSVHTHSNTTSISASILLIQPCLNTNHNSHDPSETS
ncbi:hypothetical protein AOLI_G00066190 [Acnodon oligacanthus]